MMAIKVNFHWSVAIAAFACGLGATSLSGTTIAIIRTPGGIAVGADSLVKRDDGTTRNVCKITLTGKIDFAVAGSVRYSPTDYDAERTAARIVEAGGLIKDITSRFIAAVTPSLRKTVEHMRQHKPVIYQNIIQIGEPLHFVFFGVNNGVPIYEVIIFTTRESGDTNPVNTVRYSCPGDGCPMGYGLHLLGITQAAYRKLQSATGPLPDPLSLAEMLVDTQIKATPTEVGPPVAVVGISKTGKVVWFRPGLCE